MQLLRLNVIELAGIIVQLSKLPQMFEELIISKRAYLYLVFLEH